MNKNNSPGFTAEAAMRPTHTRFGGRHGTNAKAGDIRPQLRCGETCLRWYPGDNQGFAECLQYCLYFGEPLPPHQGGGGWY